MLEDIQNLIKQFKEDKKTGQKTHTPAINSMHNSGYY